jgi:hypothetical protein
MICLADAEYVAKAVAYARDGDRLSAVKDHLRKIRNSCLLFDTTRLVGGLEALFHQMLRDYTQNNLPRPDLANLDIYHEIGISLDYEAVDSMSNEDYRALYLERLSRLHATYPIRADSRLWPGAGAALEP